MKKDESFKKEADFYEKTIIHLKTSKIPFLIGGAYALKAHTEIKRSTKDLDIFCKAGDYTRLLKVLNEEGYRTEIVDARWIAKAYSKDYLIDLIFSTPSNIWSVDDTWFKYSTTYKLFNQEVRVLAPEELIWCKSFIQDRQRYDGADIYHIILKQGLKINWQRLLMRLEPHWEILFAHIINFRFIYPSKRDIIPKWVMEELEKRLKEQFNAPKVLDQVCRGTLLSRTQYLIDIKEWGFKDIT